MSSDDPLGDDVWTGYHGSVPADHMHALGVLCARYNHLESSLLDLIQYFSGMPPKLAAFVFEKMPTNVRIQLLEKSMELNPPTSNVKDAIKHFVVGYTICANNRSLLVHSMIWAYQAAGKKLLASIRQRKDGAEKEYEFPLAVIRRVADEIGMWCRNGDLIHGFIKYQDRAMKGRPQEGFFVIGPTTLPEKPPLPEKLATNSFQK